jgi:hypothetical protein
MGGKRCERAAFIAVFCAYFVSKPLKIVGLDFFIRSFGMLKRKIVSLLLVLFVLFSFVCCGGGKVECETLSVTPTRVFFRVEKTDGKATVLDCMEYLSESVDGFSYKITGGMVTEINGKANTADFSGCWMLFTSDTELSNNAWGVTAYEGKTLGSAILGAEALVVEAGEIYAWEYTIFNS